LGYNDASYYSARKAIINAVSPKTYLGDLYTDIEHDWSCQGKIETLVVDNGKEFWSNSLDNACREIGMNVQINPKGSPWLKPLVERFFGTLKDQLIQNIPGHTFPLLKDLENYDPNKHAVMRMGKFVALFHLWIVDVYNRSTDSRGIKIPPNTLWDTSFNKLPPVLYQDQELQEFKLKTALVDERTLSKDGIQYEHLVYQNNELNEYRKYHYKSLLDDASGGKRTSRKKEKLIIKIDPDDLSFIHVYLPDWEKYLKVACVDPEGYTQGLSLHQHKVNLKLHRNLVSSKIDLDSLARVRMTIHERIQEEAEFIRNSDKRRTKTNKALAKHSNIGSDNNNTLATSAHNPLPVEDQPSITEQKAVLNNTDWDSAIDDIEAY
jgi:putative transposase